MLQASHLPEVDHERLSAARREGHKLIPYGHTTEWKDGTEGWYEHAFYRAFGGVRSYAAAATHCKGQPDRLGGVFPEGSGAIH